MRNIIPTMPVLTAVLIAFVGSIVPTGADEVQVYREDFEDGVANGFNLNGWQVETIQNEPGADNSFSELLPEMGTRFLRTLTSPAAETAVLQLTDLPPHDSVSIDLLFLAIDSSDSEFFTVTLDGVDLFRERVWARLPIAFTGANIIDVPLVLQRHLGYWGGVDSTTLWQAESAFDMGALPSFKDIAHTSNSLTLEILEGLDGPQDDESWAIDNLSVSVNVTVNFRITAIELEQGGQVTLTWTSVAGKNYGIYYNTDLAEWTADVSDGVASQGSSTTFTFPNPLPEAPRIFFRVDDLTGQ